MTVREIIKLNYQQFLFVFLAFFIMVITSYCYTSRVVEEQLLINSNELVQVAGANITSELSEAEIFLTDTCVYVEYMLQKNAAPEEIQRFFEWSVSQVIEGDDTPIIYGLMGVYGYVQGTYLKGAPAWAPPADYNPLLRPWYIGAEQENGAIHYTSSYINVTGKTIISLSRKIFDPQGGDAGVIAIDMDPVGLSSVIKDLGFTQSDYYGVVLDEDFTIITHGEDDTLIGQGFASLNKDCAQIVNTLQANGGKISGAKFTSHRGVKSIVFFNQIFTGWYAGVISSSTAYYSWLHQVGLIVSVLGFALMFFLASSLVSLYSAKFRSEEENRSKSNFLAKMSHEIRTPMNAIVGMSELILREDIPLDIHQHALGIKQASANLLSIINDILDFSKIESGKMEIVEVQYFLSSVINDVVTIIRMRLSEKPVVLLVNLDAHIPNKLTGDEVRIRQIILNILNNAVKYTEKGHISFIIEGKMEEEGENPRIILYIKVADTGIGIKEENFHKVFGDFVQFDKAANKGIEGTGLGLAITKSLCDAMGGEISFTSEYGKGTTFTISLPQRISDPAPIAVVQDPEKKSVLVYEIQELYAHSITKSLDNLGIRSQWVTIQSDFYETLKKEPYPFIFVSHVLYEGAKKILERMALDSKLVLMMEYGAEIGLRDVITLAMPAHTLSIADILNNKSGETQTYQGQGEAPIRFIAPSARILIVDDINTNLKVAEGLMAPFKMQIDTCKSGGESIELVKINNYDIVFMDHMMPEMDGIEATNIIRSLEGKYFQEMPIIALTANAVSGVKEMFLQNGMSDFLSKPIEMSRLIAILHKWLPEDKQEKYHALKNEGPPRSEEAALPLIKGIDIAKGISITGGTLDSYLSTLRIFLEDGKEKINQIKTCLEMGNIPLYTTYVHAIKSASGCIGALGLSDFSKNLEQAGKNEDIAYIEKNNALFLEEFGLILKGIEHTLSSRKQEGREPEEADTGSIEVLKQEMGELKEALDMMDAGRADEIIGRLRQGKWGQGINDHIEEVAKHILLSDYDDAIVVIDRLLAEESR